MTILLLPSVAGCLEVARDVVISHTDIKTIDYALPLRKIQEQKCRIKIFHATQTLWNSYQLSVLGVAGHWSWAPGPQQQSPSLLKCLWARHWILASSNLISDPTAQRVQSTKKHSRGKKIENNENRKVGSCESCAEVCLKSAIGHKWLIQWYTWKWRH